MTTSHLNALNVRLSNERARLAQAKNPSEIAQRSVLVAQIEREVAGEIEFLKAKGEYVEATLPELTDDELMAELLG